MPSSAYLLKIRCYVSLPVPPTIHVRVVGKFRNGKSMGTRRKRVLIRHVWCILVFGINCKVVRDVDHCPEVLLMRAVYDARSSPIRILTSYVKFI